MLLMLALAAASAADSPSLHVVEPGLAIPAAKWPLAAGEARMTLAVSDGGESLGGTYEISVARANVRSVPARDVPPGKLLAADWRVTIRCVEKCACPQAYTEDLRNGSPQFSGLMGIWQVLDVNPAIVTTWLSGNSYRVRIYGCRSGGIKKLLDEGSGSVPTVTAGGDPVHMPIITFPPNRYSSSAIVWIWAGQRYVSSSPRKDR